MSNPAWLENVRNDFPILATMINGKNLVYLDTAATSLKPRQMVERMSHHYLYESANIHRGIHTLSAKATEAYEDVRKKIAGWIGAATEDEIVFTSGTTASINLVANSLGQLFQAGDEILISELEHHSNIVPWQMLCERKSLVLKVIPMDENGDLNLVEYKKQVSKKTRLVAVNWISNSLGTINPIAEMIDLAHAAGALILIDAAQAMLHEVVNVQKLNCDFLAFSAHKMLGPTGVGVLFGKKKILESMPPFLGGGDMIKNVTFAKTTYNDVPFRFEAGTPPIAEVLGLGAAIDYLKSQDLVLFKKHESKLASLAIETLKTISAVQLVGNPKKRGSIVSFNLEGAHPSDVGTILDQEGVAVRTGHHCTQPVMDHWKLPGTVRVSFAFYNSETDVEQFYKAVLKAKQFLLG